MQAAEPKLLGLLWLSDLFERGPLMDTRARLESQTLMLTENGVSR